MFPSRQTLFGALLALLFTLCFGWGAGSRAWATPSKSARFRGGLRFRDWTRLPRRDRLDYLEALRRAAVEMENRPSPSRHAAIDRISSTIDAFLDPIFCSAFAAPGDTYCLNLGLVIPVGQSSCQQSDDMHNFETQPLLAAIGTSATTCPQPNEKPCSPFFGIQSNGTLYCTGDNWTPSCDQKSPPSDHSFFDALTECATKGRGASITRGTNTLACDALVGIFNQQSATIVANCKRHKKNCGYVRARVDALLSALNAHSDAQTKLKAFSPAQIPSLTYNDPGTAGSGGTAPDPTSSGDGTGPSSSDSGGGDDNASTSPPPAPAPVAPPPATQPTSSAGGVETQLSLQDPLVNRLFHQMNVEVPQAFSSLSPQSPTCDGVAPLDVFSEPNTGAVDPTYRQPSGQVQSNDPQIVGLAQQIVSPTDSPFAKMIKIHNWVVDNIRIDGSLNDQIDNLTPSERLHANRELVPGVFEFSALSTLQSKASVCQGYADLTVALLRASGITARVVHGFLKFPNDSTRFDCSAPQHTWVQALIDNRWYSMDTYTDSGRLDTSTTPSTFEPDPTHSFDAVKFDQTHYRCTNIPAGTPYADY